MADETTQEGEGENKPSPAGGFVGLKESGISFNEFSNVQIMYYGFLFNRVDFKKKFYSQEQKRRSLERLDKFVADYVHSVKALTEHQDYDMARSDRRVVISSATSSLSLEQGEELPHYNDFISNHVCTQPSDRAKVENIIKYYHKVTHRNPEPTFIWSASPQSSIVMAKLISDMHEHAPTRVETKGRMAGGKNAWKPKRPDRSSTPSETSTSSTTHSITRFNPNWDVRDSDRQDHIPTNLASIAFNTLIRREDLVGAPPSTARDRVPKGWHLLESSGMGLHDAIWRNTNHNPQLDFFAVGKEGKLLQTALDNSTPLSSIPLNRNYYGRRLQLVASFMGQFMSSSGTYLAWVLSKLTGPIWDYGDYVFCSERPTACNVQSLDVQDTSELRPHSASGPAIAYGNGDSGKDEWKIYAFNGVIVPEYVIENPKMITRLRISEMVNVEVRRIMIDRYKLGQEISGAAAYVKDSKGRIIDHSERFGTLYKLHQGAFGEEDIVLLEVVNRTPEPDGSFKHYHLRVPPQISTARAAVAWSFGMTPDEYDPLQES